MICNTGSHPASLWLQAPVSAVQMSNGVVQVLDVIHHDCQCREDLVDGVIACLATTRGWMWAKQLVVPCLEPAPPRKGYIDIRIYFLSVNIIK